MCWLIFLTLKQAMIIWEEENIIEKMPFLDWLWASLWDIFLINDWCGGPDPLWADGLGCIRTSDKEADQ